MSAWSNNHSLLQQIDKILRANRLEAYLVGGAIRDLLLQRDKIVDLDFAVPRDGLRTARRVADELEAAFYPLDPERGTGRVVYDRGQAAEGGKIYLDFATFRGGSLLEDLQDRDFTINAMALDLTSDPPQLIDPLQGQRDLEKGLIRAASAAAFQQDPVRVLRAVRQAIQFDFSIEPQTEQYLRQAGPRLNSVSPERRRDELLKILNTPAPGQGVRRLQQLDVLSHLLPEVEAMRGVEQSPPHHLDVFDHTTAALTAWANIEQAGFPALPPKFQPDIVRYLATPLAGDVTIQTVMPLALLLHDAGKPLTQTIAAQPAQTGTRKIRFWGHERESAKIVRQVMGRLRFSAQAGSFVETVVAHHMRPLLLAAAEKPVSRRAVYRFFRATGRKGYEAGVAVILHALADQRAIYSPDQEQLALRKLRPVIETLLETYFEQRQEVVDPVLLLTGRDLIDTLDLQEGRLIGLLLKRLREAQATGRVIDRSAALAFIKTDPDFMSYQRAKRPYPDSEN